jgi:hypothetical protein
MFSGSGKLSRVHWPAVGANWSTQQAYKHLKKKKTVVALVLHEETGQREGERGKEETRTRSNRRVSA